MKVLVTGAAGFIGCETSLKFCEMGFDVVGFDNINDYYDVELKYARLARLGIDKSEIIQDKLIPGAKGFRFIKGSLENVQLVNDVFLHEKFDAVIHLAAQAGVRYSIENPTAYVSSNIVGFLNILEGCRYNDIKHLIYASSSSVYGKNKTIPFSEDDNLDHPVSFYAATKKSNELMAHSYSNLFGLPTTGLRFFTVYGPWGRPDMAPMLFAKEIMKNGEIKVFNNGQMHRDFTYIDNIVDSLVCLVDKIPLPCDNFHGDSSSSWAPYRVYNIGNGAPVGLMEFIYQLESSFGKKVKKIYLPMQDGDVPRTWADTSKLDSVLNRKGNIGIEQGVKRFANWYKEFYGFKKNGS